MGEADPKKRSTNRSNSEFGSIFPDVQQGVASVTSKFDRFLLARHRIDGFVGFIPRLTVSLREEPLEREPRSLGG